MALNVPKWDFMRVAQCLLLLKDCTQLCSAPQPADWLQQPLMQQVFTL